MYVRKKDDNRVYWKGIVRAGDVVPKAVADANPGMFELVSDEVIPVPSPPVPEVDTAWTMTEADLDESGELDVVAEDGLEEPFEGYDEMSVRRITEALQEMELSEDELEYVLDYEAANKNRSTMIREINEMIEGLTSEG